MCMCAGVCVCVCVRVCGGCPPMCIILYGGVCVCGTSVYIQYTKLNVIHVCIFDSCLIHLWDHEWET